MADINSAIKYSKETEKTIQEKTKSIFHHKNWNDDDLLSVRKEIRDFYRLQQKGICSYCKQGVSISSASNCHIEHIAPKSLHPKFMFIPKNLCVVCADCNEIKKNQETIGEIPETIINASTRKQYPTSSNAFKIVHPHYDHYDDHILIINGFYVDKSSKKGNFTIGACNLNRKLGLLGWEPEITNDADLVSEMNSYIEEKETLKRHKHLNNIKKQLFNL
ncbi:hypothetical protein D3C87_1054570 [compost metagenome]